MISTNNERPVTSLYPNRSGRRIEIIAVLLMLSCVSTAILIGCNEPDQTATPSEVQISRLVVTPTPFLNETSVAMETSTPVPTATPMPSPTEIPTLEPIATPTPLPTETPTPVPTTTPTPSPTKTPNPEPTVTPTPLPTETPVPTTARVLSERDVLIAFFHATGGANWRNNENWLSEASLSEWYGVTTNEEGSVTKLVLNDNRLQGVLPAQISELTELEVLSFYSNSLEGFILESLGDLTRLKVLDLGNNSFTGEIPPQLGESEELLVLRLDNNDLRGAIPSELGNLRKVEELLLGDNQLSGPIPAEFGDLEAVKWLRLQSNLLSGHIPDALVRLSNLIELELQNNLFDGPIPSWIDELKHLEKLYLSNNRGLTGCLHHNYPNVANHDLRKLNLLSCEIIEMQRDALVAIYNATDGVNWKNNRNWLSDAPVGEWHGISTDSMGHVIALELDDSNLIGEIPSEIGRLSQLERLLLSFNDLEGELPAELASLSQLVIFAAAGNRLTGSLPSWIGELPNLERIALFGNQFSGEIPSSFGDLSGLLLLRLDDNELTGEIPPEIGTLSKLELLEISNNRLTGEIPIELAELSNLTGLVLSKNHLSGEVPREFGRLANLQNLRLDFNRLTGAIPPELGNLTRLENFEILENNLRGEIPDEIGNLPRLRQFFVSRNPGISGCIPVDVLAIESTDFYDVDLPDCGGAERDALQSFYEATGGDNWINHEGWLTISPLGEWYGVAVNEFGRVVGIDLTDNNLSGEIPNAFGKLSKLETVRISGNAITGCVPLSLGDLPKSDFGDLMLIECGIHFPDFRLKTAILERLGKEPGSEIYVSDLAALESLDLSWKAIRDLEGLQYATNLGSLTLGESRTTLRPDEDAFLNRIKNLAPLAQLTNLSELNLASCQLTDVSALSTLTNLQRLDIGFNRLHHIRGISGLNNLESLLVSNNHVENIADISDLSNLIHLDLSDNKIGDIGPIAGVDRLQELDISNNKVVDLAPISSLEQLQRLEIKGIGVENLSPIEDLRQLIHLNASWNEVEDLSPLNGLTALRTLMIGPAPISNIDVISGLTNLERLRIVGTDLTDVGPLSDLGELQTLVLSDNRISELSPLADLDELKALDLSFNEIEDVSPLINLSELNDLRLNGNRVRNIEPLVENRGLADSDRLELDGEIRNDTSNQKLVEQLADRGVTVGSGTLYATAFGRPQIYNDNLFVLPISRSPLSANLRLEDYASDFYEFFQDEFDFLMIISNIELLDDRFRSYSGAYYAVSNHIKGIGQDSFHNEGWGSPLKLKGALHFPWNEALGGGPVLHELMHRWGNFVLEPHPHWWYSSVSGLLGGFKIEDFEDLGDGWYYAGDFPNGGWGNDWLPYSFFELYLAGLAKADEVPDFLVAKGARAVRSVDGMIEYHDEGGWYFTADELEWVSIEDIVAEHGAREPDFADSQKEFRAAAILLIDEDHPATTEVVEEISRQVSRFSYPGEDDEWQYNFHEATRGRGTMLMGNLSEYLIDAEEK